MSEQRVTTGKLVSVSYSIRNAADDELLEVMDRPVDYLHGDGSLFPKVETALEGLAIGESVEVTLTPQEGFGDWDPALTFSDAIENVPPQYREKGAKAEFQNPDGETITMVVTHVDQGTVTLDGNHPFAGKTIIFRVTIDAIRDTEAPNGPLH